MIAVEPLNSPVLSGGKSGKHKIQGIGAGFIPETYDDSVVDEVRTVSDSAAIEAAVFLAKEKGVLVGISSGAAFYEAWEPSKLPVNARKTIVVLLPDTGVRYLSTGIFG